MQTCPTKAFKQSRMEALRRGDEGMSDEIEGQKELVVAYQGRQARSRQNHGVGGLRSGRRAAQDIKRGDTVGWRLVTGLGGEEIVVGFDA